MNDPRLLSDDELAAIRRILDWRKDNGVMSCKTGEALPYERHQDFEVLDAIAARNPEPWEPSDDDIDAYRKCWDVSTRTALNDLLEARAQGYDVVPRRIGEPS